MPGQAIEYNNLFTGFEFPPQSYQMEITSIRDYLQATGETNELYQNERLVPPLAVTAFAMNALSQVVIMPPGTIHVSQELEFLGTVRIGDTITCFSTVSRKVDRGGLRLMNTKMVVVNQNQAKVLTGNVGFVLPQP